MEFVSVMDEITDILRKYDEEELKLDQQLDERSNEIHEETSMTTKQILEIKLEDAMKRNNELLKELEIVQGKLRSKAIFSPTEIQWDAICHQYLEAPSLAITAWRCHLPIYV